MWTVCWKSLIMLKLRKIVSRIGTDIKAYYWAGIIFLLYFLGANFLFGVLCPQLIITGIPCAGCGLTRAAFCLIWGQVRQAAQINPSVFPAAFFLLYCGYFRYIKGKKIRKFGGILAILVAVMLVIYGCRMYRYFPDKEPYVYYENNLMAGRIPGYEEWISKLRLDFA